MTCKQCGLEKKRLKEIKYELERILEAAYRASSQAAKHLSDATPASAGTGRFREMNRLERKAHALKAEIGRAR